MKKALCVFAVLAMVASVSAANHDFRFWLVPGSSMSFPASFDPAAQAQDLGTTNMGDLYSAIPTVDHASVMTGDFFYIFGQFDGDYAKGRKVQGLALNIALEGGLTADTVWYQFSGNPVDDSVLRWDAGSDFAGPKCKLLGVAGTGWLNDDTTFDTGDLYVPATAFTGQGSVLLGAVIPTGGTTGEVFIELAYDGLSVAGSGNTSTVYFGLDTEGIDGGVDYDGGPDATRRGPDGIAEGVVIVPEPASLLLIGLAGLLIRRR